MFLTVDARPTCERPGFESQQDPIFLNPFSYILLENFKVTQFCAYVQPLKIIIFSNTDQDSAAGLGFSPSHLFNSSQHTC